MRVVEFLLSNWFIVVIGYIVVTAFLRKARGGGEGGSAAPKRSMPPFGGGGEGGWPARPSAPPEAQQGSSGPSGRPAAAARPVRQAMPDHRPEPAPSEARTLRRQEPPATAVEAPRAPARPSGAAADAGGGLLRLKPQDAARGLLWAEILGPPRAKRPYRR
ncbi:MULTISPECIES: hypothetical protein [Paenibacillus]|uniref:hypothetical protein n=1 Tax=Paenibacillus TaxID=44249 RepID=UPI0022B89C5E|nr:hypothetical protein [Paenibacillus caseinilyticus]MCZ8518717.1 hypothetical protein [Paenibacillus caseinilyticus]